MNEPIRIQFAKATNLYRFEVAVSPLMPREIPRVVEAFTAHWSKPEEVERAKAGGADALILIAEHNLRLDERPADLARTLTYAIWKKLDRYVKVTIEATYLGENPETHFEFGEQSYTEAFGTRFEQ